MVVDVDSVGTHCKVFFWSLWIGLLFLELNSMYEVIKQVSPLTWGTDT